MPKFNTLQEYIDTLNEDALQYYNEFKKLIKSIDLDIKERLFAGQVAYYLEETLVHTFHSSPVIVMSFRKDHVNVFATANLKYKDQLPQYKFTNKGTMQLYYNIPLEQTILKLIIIESLYADIGN